MKTDMSTYGFLDPARNPQRGGLTQHVTDSLRRAIVGLDLAPGAAIDKPAICARLGVSRFPVSEALARLQAEGLVDILPQRGSIVSLIRIADVLEFMLIRKALEAEAVRVATRSGGRGLVEALERNLALQEGAVAADDRSLFHAHDLDFHELLMQATGFARLGATIDSARANLDRARRMVLSPRRLETSCSEHRAIVTAIASGDDQAGAAAMRGHIDSVVAELVAFARAHPQPFADGDPAAIDTASTRYPAG